MNRLPVLGARVDGTGGRRRIAVFVAAALLLGGCSAADAKSGEERALERYEAALAPLKARSDVLERRYARAQGPHYRGPQQMRRVLAAIIPQYADLLERTRAIEVESPALAKAQRVLVASLERQQDALGLALRGIEQNDRALLARAGRELEQAQALVDTHRRLLAAARAQQES